MEENMSVRDIVKLKNWNVGDLFQKLLFMSGCQE